MLKFKKGNKVVDVIDSERELAINNGWTLVEDEPVKVVLKPVKKAAAPRPAVEEEVGNMSQGEEE